MPFLPRPSIGACRISRRCNADRKGLSPSLFQRPKQKDALLELIRCSVMRDDRCVHEAELGSIPAARTGSPPFFFCSRMICEGRDGERDVIPQSASSIKVSRKMEFQMRHSSSAK